MDLQTTRQEFDSLWIAFHGARGQSVPVPRNALFNLLKDHSAMAAALKIDTPNIGVVPVADAGAKR